MDKFELERLERDLPRRVTELRTILKEKHDISVPHRSDDFLKRCIRVKDFNQEKSAKLVRQITAMIKELGKQWDAPLAPSFYKNLYERHVCTPLSSVDHLGRRIVILKPGVWNPSEEKFDHLAASLWLSAQYGTIEYLELQTHGMVVIYDFSEFSMNHALNVKHRVLLSGFRWMQGGVFARFKEVHMVFNASLVSALYAAIKPFLQDKLRKRMHFHGHNLSSLHKHIDPSLLPPYLGGTLQESLYEVPDYVAYKTGLLQQDQFFKDWTETGFPIK